MQTGERVARLIDEYRKWVGRGPRYVCRIPPEFFARRAPVILFTLFQALAMGSALPVLAEGNRVNGEALAKRLCARCHVIGDYNRMGGIDSTPSFPLMAKRPEIFAHRIPTFRKRRPHPQFQWPVSLQDIADLESYILSLPVKKRP